MNREEFETLRRQYQEQMMQLYPKSPPPRTAQPTAPPMPQPSPQPMAPRQPMPMPPPESVPTRPPMPQPFSQPMPTSPPMQQPFPQPMPMPPEPMPDGMGDPPIFAAPEPPPTPRGWNGNSLPTGEALSMEAPLPRPMPMDLPPETDASAGTPMEETGTLRINVRTAEGAAPIADAIVTVTEDRGGDRALIALRSTNDSGAVTLTLPAPANEPNSRNVANAKYAVEVFAPGYLREESVDLPIFADITSVQTFTLVPLPLTSGDTDGQTYYNVEPKF